MLIRKGPFGDSIVDDACAHVLLQTSPRDIDTVMVDGKVRMRGGKLLGFDPRAAAMMRVAAAILRSWTADSWRLMSSADWRSRSEAQYRAITCSANSLRLLRASAMAGSRVISFEAHRLALAQAWR